MDMEFDATVWYWRGPAPHFFVTVPSELCDDLKGISGLVTYGWGMIPAVVGIGQTQWKTSLFPRDGGYIVPIRASVRTDEDIEEGATVTVRLKINT